MKKIYSILILFCTLFYFTIPSYALDYSPVKIENASGIVYLDDGTYIVTTLAVELTDSALSTVATTYTRTGTITVENFSSSDDTLLWQYKLTGSFTVNEGVSVTCTNATYTYSVNDSYWHFSDGNAYIENNVAHGVGVFKKKVLFVTVKTYEIDITISCDIYGNLS